MYSLHLLSSSITLSWYDKKMFIHTNHVYLFCNYLRIPISMLNEIMLLFLKETFTFTAQLEFVNNLKVKMSLFHFICERLLERHHHSFSVLILIPPIIFLLITNYCSILWTKQSLICFQHCSKLRYFNLKCNDLGMPFSKHTSNVDRECLL